MGRKYSEPQVESRTALPQAGNQTVTDVRSQWTVGIHSLDCSRGSGKSGGAIGFTVETENSPYPPSLMSPTLPTPLHFGTKSPNIDLPRAAGLGTSLEPSKEEEPYSTYLNPRLLHRARSYSLPTFVIPGRSSGLFAGI